jgi:phosphate:Na+ symporter
VALGLVLGANLGSGILAVISTARSDVATRRLPVGNLIFKVMTLVLLVPFMPKVLEVLQQHVQPLHVVVAFHVLFNGLMALLFVALTSPMSKLLQRWMPDDDANRAGRPQHLDPMALATPSLAISCAAREALHQADVVESMLRGVLPVIKNNDSALAERLRQLDDTVDSLYSAIKFYLTQISRGSLSERESRRWTDIVSFTINMEQVGDIIERVLLDVDEKKIKRNLSFSDAGMAEICHMHERLLANMRLAMGVLLDGRLPDAQRLLEEKARFRDLEREYAATHLARLRDQTAQSIETSSLHLDLISELKRINSHLCSIAYPILEMEGALANTRLKPGHGSGQQPELFDQRNLPAE